jgi:hypothetical protein
MKPLFQIAAVAVLAATPVFAAPSPVCIDPKLAYQATWLSGRDVVVRQTVGADHRQLLVTTTCTFLNVATKIAFPATTPCVGQAHMILVTVPLNRLLSCRVMTVAPYTG